MTQLDSLGGAGLSYLDLKLQKLRELRNRQDELEERNRQAAQDRAWAWMADPVAWVQENVNFPRPPKRYQAKIQGLAPYQAASMRELADNGRLLMYGPHGLGKSAEMSLLSWWFITTRELAGIDWKLITTASSWKQLKDFLWPEIHKWARFIDWERLGLREPQDGKNLLDLGFRGEWGAASAAASSDPAKMEGAHASHLMYIIDEGKAVPAPTWDAIEGAFSTEDLGSEPETAESHQHTSPQQDERGKKEIKNVLVAAMSTPGPASGRFYSIATNKPGFEDWTVRKVDKQEVIDAGRMSEKWADQRERQWGRGSSVYQMRVLGEFFTDDPEALIPLSWVEAAQQRWEDWKAAGRPPLEGACWCGVDVAGGGADRTVMAMRIGDHVPRLYYPQQTDLMAIVDEVAYRAGGKYRPVIDTLGVGAGVTSRLKEMQRKGEGRLKHPPLAFVGSASTKLLNQTGEYGFLNARSAAWWQIREALDPQNERNVILAPDEALTADLTAPSWRITESGSPPKIQVEQKDRVREKLGRSPDFGDAVAMAYWAGAQRRPVNVARKAALGGARTPATQAGAPERRSGRGKDVTRRQGGARVLGGRGGTGASSLSPLSRPSRFGQGPGGNRSGGTGRTRGGL